jgi:hypothetical protein
MTPNTFDAGIRAAVQYLLDYAQTCRQAARNLAHEREYTASNALLEKAQILERQAVEIQTIRRVKGQ